MDTGNMGSMLSITESNCFSCFDKRIRTAKTITLRDFVAKIERQLLVLNA